MNTPVMRLGFGCGLRLGLRFRISGASQVEYNYISRGVHSHHFLRAWGLNVGVHLLKCTYFVAYSSKCNIPSTDVYVTFLETSLSISVVLLVFLDRKYEALPLTPTATKSMGELRDSHLTSVIHYITVLL